MDLHQPGTRTVKCLFALLGTIIVVAAIGAPTNAAAAKHRAHPAQRIRFLRGAFTAQIPGSLSRQHPESFFVVKAQAGQRMIVNLISRTPGVGTAGTVKAPSGKQDGGPGGIIFNARLTETGAYTIRVTADQMASTRFSGRFIVEVIILPNYLWK